MAYVNIVNKFDDFEGVFFFERFEKCEIVVEDLVDFYMYWTIND